MFDIFNQPLNAPRGAMWFGPRSNGTGTTNQWIPFTRPRGASMLFALLVGGGGYGGSGFSRTAGSAGGGGGGGGCGAVTRLIIPWDRLPETIFLDVGRGGTPLDVIAAGTSRIAVYPSNTTAANYIAVAANGGTGQVGTATLAGSGGNGGAASTATSSVFANLGDWTSLVGQTGGSGGAVTGANGTGSTWAAGGSPVMSGCGGAGCTTTDFAGGGVTGAGLMPSMLGGQTAGEDGKNGQFIRFPFMASSGTGGASNNTGTGGRGGDGGPGCGGGGGGAGTTGGVGGKGGDGFIVLINW